MLPAGHVGGPRYRRGMSIPQRFTLVTLGVADVEASTAFYRRLGWRQSTHSVAGTTFFTTPGPVIALWSSAELAADAGRVSATQASHSAPPFRAVALAINFDTRDEVDAAIADWQAAGGEVTKAALETEWGGYSGYGADPDGNLWEFAHNPFWPLDEHGMPRLDGGDVD
jgi:predicted lactoylglutathione lyase